MAALKKEKLRGSAPKVRNRNRAKGYWIQLHNARSNRPGREIIRRNPRQGINGFDVGLVGSAAYRRLQMRRH